MILGLSHVGITVLDMEESLFFYRNKIGIDILSDAYRDGPGSDKIYETKGSLVRVVYLAVNSYQHIELFEFKNPKIDGDSVKSQETYGVGSIWLPGGMDVLEGNFQGPDGEFYIRDISKSQFYPILMVFDIEEALGFYRDKLGLNVADLGENKDGMEKWVVLKCDDECCLKIIQPLNSGLKHPDIKDVWLKPGVTHMTFAVKNLSEMFRNLKKQGVNILIPPQKITAGPHSGGKLSFITSNEGFLIELIESRFTDRFGNYLWDRSTENYNRLYQLSGDIRRHILNMVYKAKSGHIGGSFSEVELLTSLFFCHMRINPMKPTWKNRDRFVLSKGHASPGYYTVLSLRGYFDPKKLDSFEKLGSMLQMHPDATRVPGVEISSGSLGQGLSYGIGMALGVEKLGIDSYTYVLLGDGECQSGQIWEAAMYAGSKKVRRIIAIIDYNRVQLASSVSDAVELEPLEKKWLAFGWTVLSCDGHKYEEIIPILEKARSKAKHGPVLLIAHTIKGKGVSFMEGDYRWHGRAPTEEELELAMSELSSGNKVD